MTDIPTSSLSSSRPQWRIEARKYDQSLHYTLPLDLISDDGERLWFKAYPESLLNHVTRGWVRPLGYPSDMIFWRERWYNIFLNYNLAGELDHYYCNVGLPPVISETTLTFVDLDLDVQIWPDGSYKVLDTDEFAEHSARYGYPKDVYDRACLSVLDILLLWRRRNPPFDR